MQASLRALLTGLIDYAGLFPPAGLHLDGAVRNYARYRREPEAWMLGRFVCPVARLGELLPLARELFSPGSPLALSVLAGKGDSLADFYYSLRDDLQAVASFQEVCGDCARVDVVECRLPTADLVAEKLDAAAGFFTMAHELLRSNLRGDVAPFYEAALGPDWREQVPRVLARLDLASAADEVKGTSRHRPAGFKLRCGGLEARAFPSPEQVAYIITQCRGPGIALKATAGLHHPFRHFDPALRTPVHGFLNVFGAAVLAHARKLTEEQVRQVIEDEDPGQFVFDDQGFRWHDFHATTAEVVAARRFATSFGSCSFDEPREDLRALGWL
jgi:hypothetical protein